MKMKELTYSGTLSTAVSPREEAHAALSRRAAAEGIVLLKNDGVLPLQQGARIALFGGGAEQTIKGGTGSGDVNERAAVSIREGMENAGFVLTSKAWLDDYRTVYNEARLAWKNAILAKAAAGEDGTGIGFFFAYSSTSFEAPAGRLPEEKDLVEADAAVYVISRIAGEGADRDAKPGDYYLTQEEHAALAAVCARYEKTIVVVNAGGPIDLSFMDELPVRGLVFMSQAGMEGGNALADVLSGAVNPSGRLTDTWAYHYEDYPCAATFSHMNGDVTKEYYNEGIYVGYRYFDSFGVAPRYPFGFGLSYTTFALRADAFAVAGNGVRTVVTVENTGSVAGKQVVQLYAACPAGRLEKEAKRLVAFGKTPLLAPGEVCRLELSFPLEALASYSEEESGWLLEAGDYVLLCGDSCADVTAFGVLALDGDCLLLKTGHICPLQEELKEMKPAARPAVCAQGLPRVELAAADLPVKAATYEAPFVPEDEAGRIVRTLTEEELIRLVVGEAAGSTSNLGAAGSTVPGAAGETSNCLMEKLGIPSMVLADGPAGLRLPQAYQVGAQGEVIPPDFAATLEHGFFSTSQPDPALKTYHHYCTAFPVGTLLAQTWDVDLVREVGVAVGREMNELHVTLWLAPGMNIHRNPLCGRNFEYYAEDPVLTGHVAAAITAGVQSNPGVGTTIKHYACNNSEDNRMGVDCVLSERALREIYLKGFEIAVRKSQPMSMMSSYNLINGVHAANCTDTLTRAARDEWGFAGMVMTDWTTTAPHGGSTPEGCILAGNDLIMPGLPSDFKGLQAALAEGHLTRTELEVCAARVLRLVLLSDRMEDARPYSEVVPTCTQPMCAVL